MPFCILGFLFEHFKFSAYPKFHLSSAFCNAEFRFPKGWSWVILEGRIFVVLYFLLHPLFLLKSACTSLLCSEAMSGQKAKLVFSGNLSSQQKDICQHISVLKGELILQELGFFREKQSPGGKCRGTCALLASPHQLRVRQQGSSGETLLIYLKRGREGERKEQREMRSSICWSTPQMATIIEAGPGQHLGFPHG